MLVLAMAWDAKFRSQRLQVVDDKAKLGDNTDEETIREYGSPTTIRSALTSYIQVYDLPITTKVVITTSKACGTFPLGQFISWNALKEAKEKTLAVLDRNDSGQGSWEDMDKQPNPYEDDPPDPIIWNPPL